MLVLHLLPLVNPWLIVKMQPSYVFPIGTTLGDVHLNWMNQFHFLLLMAGLLVILIGCMILLSSFLDTKRMSMLSFFPHTARLCNSFPKECFSLMLYLIGFKSKVNRYLLPSTFFLLSFFTCFSSSFSSSSSFSCNGCSPLHGVNPKGHRKLQRCLQVM